MFGVYGRDPDYNASGALGGPGWGAHGQVGANEGWLGTAYHGVKGTSSNDLGAGVKGIHTGSGYAGDFEGDVHITGTISKGGGSFLIDHPLDPENKLLRHNFVESPENLLIYRGRVRLDANGEGVVELPDYFRALTKEDEASIHLTPVGRPFLTGAEWNPGFQSLTVYGDANREVFWEVLADRDDPVIHQLGKPVEEWKGPNHRLCDRGELLYPTAYGYPESARRDLEAGLNPLLPPKGHGGK